MARKRLQACMEGISSLFSGLFCHKFSIQVCIHRSPAKVCYNIKINSILNGILRQAFGLLVTFV